MISATEAVKDKARKRTARSNRAECEVYRKVGRGARTAETVDASSAVSATS